MYHYVLAWTGDQATAVDLTAMVLRTAVGRMEQLVEGAEAGELEMRLMALLRAAVIKRQARQGRPPAPTAVPEGSMALFEGLGRLDDTQREVLVLCDLLGQDPDRVARLLGCGREVLDELRGAGSESLWRQMHGAPSDAAVSTWQRLTVGTALGRAAAGWLHPADGPVLAYLSAQLVGEAPVGVPAAAVRRGAGKAAPAGPRPPAAQNGEQAPPAGPDAPMSPAAAKPAAKLGPTVAAAAEAASRSPADPKTQSKGAPRIRHAGPDSAPQPKVTANGHAGANGVAPAGADAAPGQPTRAEAGATTGEQPRHRRSLSGALASLAGLRDRWAAWAIAASAAAVIGVISALTLGGPVSGSPDCPGGLSCLPSTTLAANGRGTLPPGPLPTDAGGNLMPTSSLAGGFAPAPGFPLVTGSSTSTTGAGGRVPTTTRGSATTAKPPGPTAASTTAPPSITPPSTTPPTTTQPTTTEASTTTAQPSNTGQ